MVRKITLIGLLSILSTLSAAAGEKTFEGSMSNLVGWVKDYKNFRIEANAEHFTTLASIKKSSEFSKCEDTNNINSCTGIISRLVLETLEGYDQDVAYFFEDFEKMNLDTNQKKAVQRIKIATKMITGNRTASDFKYPVSGKCSRDALDSAYEKTNFEAPLAKSASFSRAFVSDLICQGRLKIEDGNQVDKKVMKNLYNTILAETKSDQRTLSKIDKLFPELK